jgi:TetR/AcrR family transcriptional repressor of nem operon
MFIMSSAEKKKQIIIEKAAVMFNEKGIAGTSVDDILKAAQFSKGCFYGHFESKEELSYASVDYLLDKLTERRNNALNKHQKAIDKIYAFMDLNKSPLKSYIDGGCPIVNLSTETDDTSPVIKKKIKTIITTAIKQFTEVMHEGIRLGELSDALNPEEFATKMFLSIEGGNAICRVLGSNEPMHVVINSLKKELAGYSLLPA